MRLFVGLVALGVAWAWQGGGQEFTHFSQVMGTERVYRIYLPATYSASQTRYPVIYWLHGFEQSSIRAEHTKEFEKFTAARDAIVVDCGPVETTGQFPLYFPELVERVESAFPGCECTSGYGLTETCPSRATSRISASTTRMLTPGTGQPARDCRSRRSGSGR